VGKIQNQSFQLSFNPSLKVDFQGSRVTSDGGLVPVQDSRLGRLSPVPAPEPSQRKIVRWNPSRDV
jgi:hypothetical protein